MNCLACEHIEVTEGSGIFFSPGHPEYTLPDERCSWHIKIVEGYRVELRIIIAWIRKNGTECLDAILVRKVAYAL